MTLINITELERLADKASPLGNRITLSIPTLLAMIECVKAAKKLIDTYKAADEFIDKVQYDLDSTLSAFSFHKES